MKSEKQKLKEEMKLKKVSPPEIIPSLETIKEDKRKGHEYRENCNCAKCMGVSVNTLKKITSNLRELDVWLADPQRVAVFKDNEASVLDGMRASIMNIISSIINNKKLADKATFSNLPSLNILYGTLFDKQRLYVTKARLI